MTSADDIVLVAAARTPQGRMSGQFASLPATSLGSRAIAGALERGGIVPSDVDAVIFGQVLAAGAGQNAARQAAIGAGLGWDVPAHSVNKVCLSGLTAVIDAARMIRTGDATTVVAGGHGIDDPRTPPAAEVAGRLRVRLDRSARPHGPRRAHRRLRRGEHGRLDREAQRPLRPHPRGPGRRRGTLAPARSRCTRIGTVRRRDRHRRGAAAQGRSRLDHDRRGHPPDTTCETLARLRPAFAADGTITAGNASQISDGASAVVVTTRDHAEAKSWDVLADTRRERPDRRPRQLAAGPARPRRSHAPSTSRGSPRGPRRRRDQRGVRRCRGPDRSASSGLATTRNPNGGGIALGHPIGASGARLVVTAVHELAARGGGTAAVALCGGGGQGDALILTR